MSWSRIAKSIPEQAGCERDAIFIRHIENGRFVHRWSTIVIERPSHTIELDVSEDALALGSPDDCVRINVSAHLAQAIADRLGAMMLTPRVADLIYQRAPVRVPHCPQLPDAYMATTSRMIEHDRQISAKIKASGAKGLVSTVGRDWVLTNRLADAPAGTAACYGWYIDDSEHPGTLNNIHVLQPLQVTYDANYSDYSHVWRGMKKTCRVNGVERSLEQVLQDPTVAPILSHEGVLTVLRQPGTTEPPQVERPVGRALTLGMNGSDVARWQQLLKIAMDGQFGPITELATKSWQRENGYEPTGIVSLEIQADCAMSPCRDPERSRFYKKPRYVKHDTIVIHPNRVVAALPERTTIAKGATRRYYVEGPVVCCGAAEEDEAFRFPGKASRAMGIQHIIVQGKPPPSSTKLNTQYLYYRSAKLISNLCDLYKIPFGFCTEEDLLKGYPGITTQATVARAFNRPVPEPDLGFPLDEYLDLICAVG